MKKNMGNIDRAIRIMIALVLIVLYFTNIITGTLAIVLLIVSALLIVTSIFGICPAYLAFGINTTKKE
jgi:hypothetical protein